MTHALIGGAIGGVLSAIPLFGLLNRCFCLLNQVGAGAGLAMYLKANPNDRVSTSEAAAAGAISGAVAGFIAGVVGFVIHLAIGSLMSSFYRSLPPQALDILSFGALGVGILGIPVNMVVSAGFGALGGILAMQLFFKDRIKP